MTRTYELNGATITVEYAGEGSQPWEDGGRCYIYRVSVSDDAGHTWETPAYGSQMDYENGQHDPQGIGAMVAGELLSAYYDPDEFYQLATDGAEAGYETRYERALNVMRLIESAGDLGPILEANQDAIEAMENGGQVSEDA